MPADGHLASNVIGENVYNGAGDDAENIGNVNDLVMNNEGQIESVVIGVGGFIGIGEKNVAISFNELDWAERDGDRYLTVPTTKDALTSLPAFDRRAYDPQTAATASNTAAPAGGTMTTVPASGATTTTDTAMAPAANTTTTTTAPVTATTPTAGATTAAPAGTAMAPAAGGAAMNSTDTTTTAAVDRSQMTEVPADQLSAENLEGTTVYGANEENVGDIGDVILTSDGQVDAVIIDVGGFLGIGEKQVAVGMDDLAFMQDAQGNRYLYTNFTEEQLEAQPEYNEENWASQRDQMRMINR
jgi:sporulation protein YlmC with PRC-barrel domain